MRRLARFLVLPLLLTACSDVTGTEDRGLTAHEAEAFAGQVGRALANGMAGAGPTAAPLAASSALEATGPASVPVNVQLHQRTNCTAGGHIEVSGSLTGNMDETGSGALFLQVLETISDWRCVGERVINGAPYISAAGTFTFLDGQQSGTASISFGGAFSWGTGSSEGCQLTLTALFRPDHTGRMTGALCGHPVSVDF